jgi:DNA-binding NarL/FixJ family response regulator
MLQHLALAQVGHLALPPELPDDPQSPAGRRSAGKDDAKQPIRILIVEDDFLIALQSEAALSDAGYDVVGTATTAEEAILLANETRPALVLMDIRLASERDGIDAAGQLFRDLNIRCIFATAHDDPGTRERARPWRPLGWLAKPYNPASLISLVASALSSLD